jgi:hypothetical protein
LLQSAQPDALALTAVVRSDLDEATSSLDPTIARAAIEQARQCKAPIAFVTLALASAQTPASIRIRSGDYLSPPIRITDSPRRVALPFPAPYQAGKGFLSIEGAARGLSVWLSPGRHIETLNGAQTIPVVWAPRNPC